MKKRYLCEVKGYGRVSVFYVEAISPAHARAMAEERCGISVDVTEQIDRTLPDGSVADDFTGYE